MVKLVSANLKGVIKLQPGSRVQVQGLSNQKELNGLVGRLLQWDAVKLRWGVELPNGKKILLKLGNLIPVDAEMAEATAGPNGMPIPSPTGAAQEDGAPAISEDVTACADSAAPAAGAAEPRLPATPPAAPAPQPTPPATDSPAAGVGGPINIPALTAVIDSLGGACSPPPAPAEPERAPDAGAEGDGAADAAAEDAGKDDSSEWPVLPTSAETGAKMKSGCWFDGGSAAKRFTEQLLNNDEALLSVCLVPPKRFNDEDSEEICRALRDNTFCTELVASGHSLSSASCEGLASMLRTNKNLQLLSVGDSTLGDNACHLFEGLRENTSITSLDLEQKGLTEEACRALVRALTHRSEQLNAASLASLRLSRNTVVAGIMAELAACPAPSALQLCECTLAPGSCPSLGAWVARGVSDLDLRDNSALGGEGVELLMGALVPAKGQQSPPVLRRLRLDGCSIGDDGLESIADALRRGLMLEDLFVERCEITVAGCEALVGAMRGRRLRTLSARANVIGDPGCTLLAQCAAQLDLSSTSLSGQVLTTLGGQPLESLELFSNPALGPAVETWCSGFSSEHWQHLKYLDLSGCGLQNEGFDHMCLTLSRAPELMPVLEHLCLGANGVEDTEERCESVERLCEARRGRLRVVWQNT